MHSYVQNASQFCRAHSDRPNTEGVVMRDVMGGAPLVLVVDDEPAVVALVKVVLERNEVAVLPAASGAEAVERYREQRQAIRLVLLDVRMPELDGLQTLEALRQ